MLKPFTARLMAKLLVAIPILVVLSAGPAAIAQTTGRAGASNDAKQSQSFREAPVDHRQPRADQFPSEKGLGDPNDPLNKENAALDRKLRSICRGC
jgi:hypothetical protein